ncbi:unnamed protein product [Spodoptera littoralis]|uniref:Uncharacterized protein n=1 Tax=Spodoptera littoralis TaxID=7109 RepID=A0A9P0N973_SPOLI|nr:unnamed protein product [Spodoptera littoralis]CAH1645985.1 unnamed protein product [Spodoptera littoralis]
MSSKYRRVGGGPRTHWPLSTHPSLHIRTILRDSRFHCHSTRRPGASRSHGTHQHRRFNSTAATAAVEWTTRASVGARGVLREVQRNAERAVRDDARDSPPPTDGRAATSLGSPPHAHPRTLAPRRQADTEPRYTDTPRRQPTTPDPNIF